MSETKETTEQTDKSENKRLVKIYEDEIKKGLTVQEIIEEDEDEFDNEADEWM